MTDRQLPTIAFQTADGGTRTTEKLRGCRPTIVPRGTAGPDVQRFDPLDVRQGGDLAGQWEGVSGRPGSQDPALQGEVGRGPIPEGDYIARQGRLQQRPTGAWEEFSQLWPRGSAWPGGQRAWGDWRVWLDPLPGTDTLGRSGFSIHGGAVPGSAGCIDLCGGMPSFVDSFRQQGRDMQLRVQYPR